jgi:hypothetical protein
MDDEAKGKAKEAFGGALMGEEAQDEAEDKDHFVEG